MSSLHPVGERNIFKPRKKIYIFHRADMWYPIELRDDEDAIANAKCNPGTTKVTDDKNKIVWELEVS